MFMLVGLSGFIINYIISHALAHGPILNLWYIHATIIGIAVSTTSNFILNKLFTFKDKSFKPSHLLKQYTFYVIFTLFGSGVQLVGVWSLVEFGYSYSVSLLIAVSVGAISNFLLNKKWTFQERIWH